MGTEIFNIPEEFISRHSSREEELPQYRGKFMRDRDRVMYCTAFRRLAGKTQIFTIGNDDHKKNRLTHSLEVAQISRTIAKALHLNEDLAEAIALAHDFGHTPFGHAGETILNEIMVPNSEHIKNSPYYKTSVTKIKQTLSREGLSECGGINFDSMFGFKHNIQSLRVAAILEDSYRGNSGENIGLDLTNYTLWGMMNHSKLRYSPEDVYPNFQNQFSSHIKIPNSSAEAWSFEAYIVKIADDIAQWHHDLEDAIRGDVLPIKRICETVNESLNERLKDSELDILNSIKDVPLIDRKCIADISHIVVNALVTDLVETSTDNMEKIEKKLKNNFPNLDDKALAKKLYADYDNCDIKDDCGKMVNKSDIITFSEKINGKIFEKTIKKSVHHSKEVERMNEKGKYILRKLFEAYYAHPQQLPDGPILHFMVDIGEYKTIEEARQAGLGDVRTKFDEKMKNPKLIVRSVLLRRVCDHIASMTDRYAMEEYRHLYG